MVRFTSISAAVGVPLGFVNAAVAGPRSVTAASTPAFFLAGDSTTAVQSADGGGWGNGFLSFLQSPAYGVNLGHDGATTVSFVSGGDWDTVKSDVSSSESRGFSPYVTIQFGHNDQKEESGITLDEYQANLQSLATDILNLGGTPFLVTPLTRRSFSSEYVVSDSLHDQRLRTIAAAEAVGVQYLDLNQASINYVDAIGDTAAQRYDLNGNDTTHLNDWGSVVFGRMLADLMLAKAPSLSSWINSNTTLTQEIADGVPA